MEPSTDPLNLPGPLPNVAGADANLHGLPNRGELSLQQRLTTDVSALADLGLRAFAASMVAFAMLPALGATMFRRSASRGDKDNLRFYAQLGAAKDPTLSFPAPQETPRVSFRPANRVAQWLAAGRVDNIEFESCFEPVNPALRDQWRRLTRNNVVHAQHWRHDDGPHPTLCVIHGFMGSPYFFNGLFFQLPWFYRCGYDVVLYTLPFHGKRSEKYSPFSGYGYVARGLAGVSETMAQAVHDFRSIIDYLHSTGVEKIALTGLSLGAYTSALIAGIENRLEAVIPNVPVVSVQEVVDAWFPVNHLLPLWLRLAGSSPDEFWAASRYYSPLNYAPLVPKERRLIIAGLGDRLAPPEQAEMLWQHWDHCDLHWFPGSHILHVSQPEYLRRTHRFLREFMFT